MDVTRTQPPAAALASGEFLVISGEGQAYSEDEAEEWLAQTGWRKLERRPLAGPPWSSPKRRDPFGVRSLILVGIWGIPRISTPSVGVSRRGLYSDVVRLADLLDRSRRGRHRGVEGGDKLPVSRRLQDHRFSQRDQIFDLLVRQRP